MKQKDVDAILSQAAVNITTEDLFSERRIFYQSYYCIIKKTGTVLFYRRWKEIMPRKLV